MGTALTLEQAARLKRLAPRIVVCYDGDSAGRNAARAALSHLLAQGLEVSVARLPADEDPDDVRRREGPEALAARIAEAPGYLPWLLEELRPSELRISAEEKKGRIRSILDVLSNIPDRILRYEEYRRVSADVGVPVEVLWSDQPGAGPRGSSPARPAVGRPPAAPPSPAAEARGTQGNGSVLYSGEIPPAELRLLRLLVRGGEQISLIRGVLRSEHVTHPGVRSLVETFEKGESGSGAIDFQKYLAHLREPSDISLISRLALDDSPEPTEEDVRRLLRELEKKHLKREQGALIKGIRRAEEAGQGEEVSRLMQRAKEIGKRMMELQR
jgi:DNA primase